MGVTEDLDLFEQQLGELIIKYEQYFLGMEKREPLRLLEKVERLSRRYQSGGLANTMQRFRFNSLLSRFVTYRQYWTRINRLIEEGKYSRDRFKMKIHEQERGIATPQPSSPANNELERVFMEYVEARVSCNLSVDGISPAMIGAAIDKQRPLLMEKFNCRDVEFRVVIEEGKPKIKARPVT